MHAGLSKAPIFLLCGKYCLNSCIDEDLTTELELHSNLNPIVISSPELPVASLAILTDPSVVHLVLLLTTIELLRILPITGLGAGLTVTDELRSLVPSAGSRYLSRSTLIFLFAAKACSISCAWSSLSTRRRILPDADFGISDTNRTPPRRRLWFATRAVSQSMTRVAFSGVGWMPALRTM
jgi:hypothetical protein